MTASAVVGGIIVAAWLLAAVALDRLGHQPDVVGTFDALVVPGAAVRPGGLPSGALARRVTHAVDLWRRGVAPRIVFTGGPTGGEPSEAAVASAHAAALGVPASARVTEEHSTSTEQNAACAARLVGSCRVVVVTDSYHAFRCRRVFARHFTSVEVATTRPPPATALRLAVREVGVVLVYAAQGWLSARRPGNP